MRIFERLRDPDRNNTSIERRLFETISEYILRRIEEGTDASVMPESKSSCCSCCSAEAEAH
jgi:hypothetical protein